jgi:hypothetical protein
MKSGAHIAAIALIGAMVCSNVPLQAAETQSITRMRPLMAASLDAGNNHIVSYFLSENGVCRLTLMIDEHLSRDDIEATTPTRLQVSVLSGDVARFGTMDGKTLQFACEDGARMMSATELGRVALNPTVE